MWERFSALAGLSAHSQFLLYFPTCDEFYVELIYLLAVSGSLFWVLQSLRLQKP